MAGSPFANRKIQINATAIIDVHVAIINMYFIALSLKCSIYSPIATRARQSLSPLC
jgi:hypothetical protein